MPPTVYWTLVQASQAPLDRPELFLSPSGVAKYVSLRFPKRRLEWALGRWAAKRLFQSLPDCRLLQLAEIEIHNLPDGAPFILLPGQAGTPGCLTISHCEQMALCGFVAGQGLKIGADLEKIELRSRAFVEDYFTPVEHDLVDSFPEELRTKLVNLIWSAKESMLKALGVGLHWDTRKVEVWQIDDLYPVHPDDGEWHIMRLGDCEDTGRKWQGWWTCRGDFVLTLACFHSLRGQHTSVRLVERTA